MKFWYDFHIHTSLSPCGDNDMTPNNIVNMALLNELDIIAVSDHNTCKNLRSVEKVADAAGLIFLPGMELETAEEIHVLCLFGCVENAIKFENEVVVPALPPVKNNERIFGRQVLYDELDNEIGIEDRYLINATTIGIDAVWSLVRDYGGIAIPAHIDKQTKSLISVLGMTDVSMNFRVFELSKNAPENYQDNQFSLKGMDYGYISNSDAHYLYDIADKTDKNFLIFDKKPTASEIIEYFCSI